MSGHNDELKGLKKIDHSIVEAVGILVVQGGAILIAGVSGIAVLTVIPILLIADMANGNLDQVWRWLLLEVTGIYLFRGIIHFLKGIDGSKE
jgi:hypothetical protein